MEETKDMKEADRETSQEAPSNVADGATAGVEAKTRVDSELALGVFHESR